MNRTEGVSRTNPNFRTVSAMSSARCARRRARRLSKRARRICLPDSTVSLLSESSPLSGTAVFGSAQRSFPRSRKYEDIASSPNVASSP